MSGPQTTLTKYGFQWGPCEVVRLYTNRGEVCMRVCTKRGNWIIRVTEGGLVKTWKEPKNNRHL